MRIIMMYTLSFFGSENGFRLARDVCELRDAATVDFRAFARGALDASTFRLNDLEILIDDDNRSMSRNDGMPTGTLDDDVGAVDACCAF